MKRLLPILLALFLVACSGCAMFKPKAGVYIEPDGRRIVKSSTIRLPRIYDKFSSLIFRFDYGENGDAVYMNVHYMGGSWLHTRGGRFADKSPMRPIYVDKDVGYCAEYGCTVHERSRFRIIPAEMERLAKKNHHFKLFGPSHRVTVLLPAHEAQKFIDLVKVSIPGKHKFVGANKNEPEKSLD